MLRHCATASDQSAPPPPKHCVSDMEDIPPQDKTNSISHVSNSPPPTLSPPREPRTPEPFSVRTFQVVKSSFPREPKTPDPFSARTLQVFESSFPREPKTPQPCSVRTFPIFGSSFPREPETPEPCSLRTLQVVKSSFPCEPKTPEPCSVGTFQIFGSSFPHEPKTPEPCSVRTFQAFESSFPHEPRTPEPSAVRTFQAFESSFPHEPKTPEPCSVRTSQVVEPSFPREPRTPEQSDAQTFQVGKSSVPATIHHRWSLHKILVEGSYGAVFSAWDHQINQEVAVKIEKMISPNEDSLPTEFEVYTWLKLIEGQSVGLPRCLHFGRLAQTHNVLVLEKLGWSLSQLQRGVCGGRMSLKTLITLAAQGVRRLEQLHHVGYVHRNVKPDNMLISERDPTRMYLVDFGLAAKYVDERGRHVAKREGELIGTPLYCSINAHIGILPSRRCDLESLGYAVVELGKGCLPWSCGTSWEEIYRRKLEICLMDLCSGLGREFEEFFEYVRRLKYEERPDYGYLGDLFKRAMRRHGYSRDRVMDWC